MGAVKQAEPLVECYYCGQLVMQSCISEIPMADGPDDFTNVPMCDHCAEIYAQAHADEPEMEEGEEDDLG